MFSQLEQDSLFDLFHEQWHFPQYLLTLGFFAFAMWPVNQFYFFNIFTSKSEIIEKGKKDKGKKEAD
jgi:hypothetical protein